MLNPLWLKIYMFVIAVVGLLMCFYGYRIFRLVLALFGVVMGAVGAGIVGYQLAPGNTAVAIFCACIGGLLGGVLFVAIYYIGLFFFGAGFGAAIAAAIMGSHSPNAATFVIIAFAVIGGIIALLLQRIIIIVGTALEGASMLTSVLWIIYTGYPLSKLGQEYPKMKQEQSYVFLGGMAALALAGIVIQFITTSEKHPLQPPPQDEPVPPSA